MFAVSLKYDCALIAQIDESGLKGRHQLSDTPSRQNKGSWLAG